VDHALAPKKPENDGRQPRSNEAALEKLIQEYSSISNYTETELGREERRRRKLERRERESSLERKERKMKSLLKKPD
jgi:hypothetical protein